MKNIHILPTDKPSRFGLHNEVLDYAPDKSYVTRLKALIKKNNLKSKFN